MLNIENYAKIKLLEEFKTTEQIYKSSINDFYKINLHYKYIKEIKKDKILEIENEKKILKQNEIKTIFITDKKYPEKLKKIDNPPFCIYCKGNINLLNETSIGIIGSRNASKNGKYNARKFSEKLSEKYVVISGLAKGIDTEAHIGSLKNKEKAIAVIGSGLDIIYPKENEKLYELILEKKGLIISEYRLGTKSLKENFPMRNRIISGLSDGILVVEAGKRSGSLITVEFALLQGKDIFVIPGDINNPMSKGTNSLIKDGAILVDSYDEINLKNDYKF